MCKETNQNIVYRALRDDENLDVGLIAKNPKREMSITGHVVSGSRNKGSQFISTTRDINVAKRYAGKNGRIVAIDLKKLTKDNKIYDLSTEVGRDKYLKGVTAKNFAKKSKEVLITGHVKPNAIRKL